VLKIEHIEIKL